MQSNHNPGRRDLSPDNLMRKDPHGLYRHATAEGAVSPISSARQIRFLQQEPPESTIRSRVHFRNVWSAREPEGAGAGQPRRVETPASAKRPSHPGPDGGQTRLSS